MHNSAATRKSPSGAHTPSNPLPWTMRGVNTSTDLWPRRRPRNVKTSEAGSTCSTWMTTSALAASHKGGMPYVNIRITREGATPKHKAALIRGVTQLLVDVLDKNPETTVVTIEEVDTDNWGIGGVSLTERRRHEKESRRRKGKA